MLISIVSGVDVVAMTEVLSEIGTENFPSQASLLIIT